MIIVWYTMVYLIKTPHYFTMVSLFQNTMVSMVYHDVLPWNTMVYFYKGKEHVKRRADVGAWKEILPGYPKVRALIY